jgi:hypothetical protein
VKLSTFVHVVDGDRSAVFGPDDTVPEWAVEAITNPDVWAEPPTGAAQQPSTAGDDEMREPPRGGPGSSAGAWREFAEAQNLDVPDGASARDIQAIWDARS